VTILVGNLEESVWLSARNLKNISILQAEDASAYDLLDCEVVLFDKTGVEILDNQLS
jgi:large subunit ribosomal protein L4